VAVTEYSIAFYKTDDYFIKVQGSNEDKEVLIYVVKNRVTDVVEYEDYMLPRAIDALVQMQERLGEARSKYNTPPPVVFTVVEPKKLN
jgi:hypothetical protein